MSNGALLSLRTALQGLAATRGGVPADVLCRLAHTLPPETGVTLDLAASRVVGTPVVVVRPRQGRPAPALLAGLSSREQEVALLLAQGLRNREIARRLHISVPTVKDHVHKVLRKTGLPSRAAVAAALVT